MRIKAILYNGEYFMLPEGCENGAALIGKYKGKQVTLPWLREIKCMAPYFVTDRISKKTLVFSRDDPVFDCEAELLTADEYNSRMRTLINGHCADCSGYTPIDDTDGSLEGHHEEITLDDVCFLKDEHNDEEHDFPPYDLFAEDAVEKFPGLGLEKLADAGEYEKAAGELMSMLWDEAFVPAYPAWIYKAENGRYRAVVTTMAHDSDGIIVEYIFKKLTEAYGGEWEFFNYIPRGFLPPEARAPEKIYRTREESGGGTFGVAFTTADGDGLSEFLYVCGICGEKELRTATHSLQKYDNADDDMEEISLKELLSDVSGYYDGIPADERLFPPPCPSVYVPETAFDLSAGYDGEKEFIDENGIMISHRSIALCENVVVPVINGKRPADFRSGDDWLICIVSNGNLPVCQLTLDLGGLPDGTVADHPDLLDRVQREVNCVGDAVKKSGSAVPFAQCFDLRMRKLQIWYVILRYSRFMYTLRRLDPVFRVYPGALRLFTASGKSGGEFIPGYKMLKIRTEEQMISDLKDREEE